MHDSIKTFFEGVHKVCPPAQTCRVALAALQRHDPPILERYKEIRHPSGVPHYRVIGTAAYRRIVGTWRASGKGHSSDQALASGLMELVERYSCYSYLEEARGATYAPRRDLDDALSFTELASFVFRAQPSSALSAGDLETTPVTWFAASALDGRETFVPARLVTFALQGSNGMASGNTLEEALLHGVLEVIERHCQTQIIVGGSQAPRIDGGSVDSPLACDLLERLGKQSRRIVLRDFSLGLGIPVVAAARELDDQRVQVTVGSATTREEALIRAITENVQGEGLQNCYTPAEAGRFLEARDDPVPFPSLRDIDDVNIRCELDTLAEILGGQGMRVIYMDTTSPGLGIPSIMSWVIGTQFHSGDISHRSLLSGFLYDAQMSGHRELTRHLATRAIDRDRGTRPLARIMLALDALAAGDLIGARDALRSVATDDGSVSAFEVRSLEVLRHKALAFITAAVGDEHATQEECLAILALDDTVTPEFLALSAPAGVDPATAAETARLFGEVRQFWLLGGRSSADDVLAKYRAFLAARKGLQTALDEAERLFLRGEDDAALARARAVIAEDRLGAEFLQARWLTGRCLARRGRWAEARDELEAMGGLEYDDPRFVMLLELCRKRAGGSEPA